MKTKTNEIPAHLPFSGREFYITCRSDSGEVLIDPCVHEKKPVTTRKVFHVVVVSEDGPEPNVVGQFKAGKDFTEDGADHATYTIDDIGENHRERIKIYGSSELRDRIVVLLNGVVEPKKTSAADGIESAVASFVKLLKDAPTKELEYQRDRLISNLKAVVAPEPEYDWNLLWSMLPPWINWVAMDETGPWYGYEDKPENVGDGFSGSGCILIPAPFAPPVARDWKNSLRERP